MAKNPPPGAGRVGAVRKRAQVYNPKNKRWTKMDKKSGRFMDQNSKPARTFKGVRKVK